jgi:hypothetical protein
LDPDHYQAMRGYVASHPETTMRECLQEALEQYLKAKGAWVDTQVETAEDTSSAIRLRSGRRPKSRLLEDAIIILDDGETRASA